MPRGTRIAVFLLAVAFVAVAVACGAPTITPVASLAPVPTPGPTVDDRPATDAELDAQRFRESFGLRADLAWIRIVGDDQSSDRQAFGIPLTAGEVSELFRRSKTLEEFREPVISYADSQPDYAGAWIDHDRGGVLVVQFAGPTLPHQAAILSMVRPGAPIEIRQVRWSTTELEALSNLVRAEKDWFATIPAYVWGYGPNTVENKFSIELSTADPDVAAKILAHFSWPEDMLIVNSDGTGALLLKPGTLEIRAVDEAGEPIEGLACVAIPDIDGAHESRPLPMPTTDVDGVCTIEAAASGYTIHLERGHAPPTVVATGRATVTPRKLTQVTIVVR